MSFKAHKPGYHTQRYINELNGFIDTNWPKDPLNKAIWDMEQVHRHLGINQMPYKKGRKAHQRLYNSIMYQRKQHVRYVAWSKINDPNFNRGKTWSDRYSIGTLNLWRQYRLAPWFYIPEQGGYCCPGPGDFKSKLAHRLEKAGKGELTVAIDTVINDIKELPRDESNAFLQHALLLVQACPELLPDHSKEVCLEAGLLKERNGQLVLTGQGKALLPEGSK